MRTDLAPPAEPAAPTRGTTHFAFLSDPDGDDELREDLARRRLSALAATTSGATTADRAARMVRVSARADWRSDSPAAGPAHTHRALGCEVCRSPAVPEGLCNGCRHRLSLPLIDPDAALEAACHYRAEHPRGPDDTSGPAGGDTSTTTPPAKAASEKPELVVVDAEESAAAG